MSRAIVIVGGQVRHEKLARWRRAFTGSLEWLHVDRDGSHRATTLVGRMEGGRVRALILLEGLLDHAFFTPVIAAARRTGVPIVYAGRAGIARVGAALSRLA